MVDRGDFGLVTAFAFTVVSSALLLSHAEPNRSTRILGASVLLVLVLPGLILESVGLGAMVFVGWTIGTGIGAYAGIAAGMALRGGVRHSAHQEPAR